MWSFVQRFYSSLRRSTPGCHAVVGAVATPTGSPRRRLHGVCPGIDVGVARCAGLAVMVVALGLSGCATAPSSQGAASTSTVGLSAEDEIRALLLLLTDRMTYDPITISRTLDAGPEGRRQLAFSLARIGDRRGGVVLEGLLGDGEPTVRRAAAFALGELGERGYPEGATALLGAVHDADLQTGRLAVEALAKIGVTLEDILPRLSQAPGDQILARLIPSLFRFRSPAVLRWSAEGLASKDAQLRAMAAYGAARNPQPEGVGLLRSLLVDEDPWIRGWGARGLGQVGDRSDLARLRLLLDDAESGPIIQALRAGRRLVDDAKAAAPQDWRPRLLELLDDRRPGVRLSAIEASAAWLLDESLSAALVRFAVHGVRRERELALIALAEGGDPQGALLTVQAAMDTSPAVRIRAAEAAALFADQDVLQQLANDAHPGVRRTVLDLRLVTSQDEQAVVWVRQGLTDRDPAVRGRALEWLAENPLLPARELVEATDRSRRDRMVETRLAAVRALAQRAESEAAERQGLIVVLREIAKDTDLLVRREAIAALGRLQQERPKLGSVADQRPVRIYRNIARQTASPRRVRIETTRGPLEAQLLCPDAPMTCLNFLQLASQGFYEGLEFHRVVPDFVVQGGDPRGDGAGGPGYTIRDEMNLLRYGGGVLGMALTGPDTGGSQFFITLSPQPHLDGGYTAFGHLVAGFEILPQIIQGDRILRIFEVTPR